jgi:acetyltransferase-like isoleucine patch superfamily enzyme
MSQVKGEKIDTGLTSLGTMTGDEVKFGIQSGTMPGVLIGSSAMVGPGTLVFENLKDGSKLSTRFEQKKE